MQRGTGYVIEGKLMDELDKLLTSSDTSRFDYLAVKLLESIRREAISVEQTTREEAFDSDRDPDDRKCWIEWGDR